MRPSEGLPPLANAGARILILGSMPGAASLRKREYYAHPRNQFWDIIEHLFGIERHLPYAERCRRLTAAGIAVWDVIGRCLRRGSLDTRIVASSIVANDLATFLARHRRIRRVFFNGLKSEQIYASHVSAEIEQAGFRLTYRRLPSTSPGARQPVRGRKIAALAGRRRVRAALTRAASPRASAGSGGSARSRLAPVFA